MNKIAIAAALGAALMFPRIGHAADPAKAGIWTVGQTYHFHVTEARSATPATDNKPVTIEQDVAVQVAAMGDDQFEMSWTSSNPKVSPDEAPIKANVPQLRDSILFQPGVTLKFALNARGQVLQVSNVDDIAAAVRRGFPSAQDKPQLADFFAHITSRDAIEGGVAKPQIALVNAAAAARADGNAQQPMTWPGTQFQVGLMSFEIVDAGGAGTPRHTRMSKRVGSAFVTAETKDGLKKIGLTDDQIAQYDADYLQTSEFFGEAGSFDPRELLLTESTSQGGESVTLRYDVVRVDDK